MGKFLSLHVPFRTLLGRRDDFVFYTDWPRSSSSFALSVGISMFSFTSLALFGSGGLSSPSDVSKLCGILLGGKTAVSILVLWIPSVTDKIHGVD